MYLSLILKVGLHSAYRPIELNLAVKIMSRLFKTRFSTLCFVKAISNQEVKISGKCIDNNVLIGLCFIAVDQAHEKL